MDVLVLAISSSTGREFDAELAFFNGGERVELTVSSPDGTIQSFVGTASRSGHVRLLDVNTGRVLDGLIQQGAARFRLRVTSPGNGPALWSCEVVG
jgi:hypothetical protein